MSATTSDDRLVTVLLTTTLGRVKGADGPPPLGPVGWSRLASTLDAADVTPASLLTMSPAEIEALNDPAAEPDRLMTLVRRAGPVAMELEHLADLGIWVMTGGDADYPDRLRTTLGRGAPPVLFGSGERTLLSGGGLAIVGSRDAGPGADAFAVELASRAAAGGTTVISGAARGIDSAAMRGAIEGGGRVVGVSADRLDRRIRDPEIRDAILVDRLALITPYVPSSGFSVRTAMGRNKLIYGLATVAVVVSSSRGSGGTWAGATEALKLGQTPVFVWDGGDQRGRSGLIEAGAHALPSTGGSIAPEDLAAWAALTEPAAPAEPQMGLFSETPARPKARRSRAKGTARSAPASQPAPDVLAFVEQEAAAATSDIDLRRRLDLAPPELRSGIHPHWLAFDYALRDSGDGQLHERFGGLGPRHAMPDGSAIPPLVADVEPAIIEAWRIALARVTSPHARARYGDLLWQRHEADAPAAARAAIDGYLAIVDGSDSPMSAAKGGARAVDLALELNDRDRLSKAGVAIVGRIDRSLASDVREPGLVVRLAAAASRIPAAQAPVGLDEAISRIETAYEAEPPLLDGLADIQERRAQHADRLGVRRRQVARWQALAETDQGGARMFHLQRALAMAQSFGLHPEIEELKLALQSIDHSSLDLKRLETAVDVDRGPIVRTIARIVGDDSFPQALGRMVDALGPIAGDPEANEKFVDEMTEEFPLQSMFPAHILGPEQTTIRIAISAQDHRHVGVARQEGISIAFYGTLVVDILDAALERYGLPPETDLSNVFTGPLVESEKADKLARATIHYLRGDADAAGHLLAPRLEAILRRLARTAGLLVTRPPSGVRTGGVLSLGDILSSLRGRIDEAWRRFFVNLLSDPLGRNLRNDIGHGLIDEVSRDSAAVLIYAAVALARFESVPAPTPADQAVSDPIAP